MGYHQAGFTEIIGIDIEPMPNYPFDHRQGDALSEPDLLAAASGVDLIHASPPCQAYSRAQKLRRKGHPDLIHSTRELLLASGKPFVIENVPGSPLRNPTVFCGAMFGLGTYRHRLFEAYGFLLPELPHPAHNKPITKMGRPPKSGEMMHVVGNFSGAVQAREAMGIDWMTRDELREAVPPAYAKFVGEVFISQQVAA
jgi:DNA (cytosine-5)-methyltransferase 1